MTDKQIAAHTVMSNMLDLYRRASKRQLTPGYLKTISGRQRMSDEKANEISARITVLMDQYMDRMAKLCKKDEYIQQVRKEAENGE